MKRSFLISLFFVFSLFSTQLAIAKIHYSIAFVHIGDQLPPYLETAISQARLFNPECDIYLIANESAIVSNAANLAKYTIKTVHCESLKKSSCHQLFLKNNPFQCPLGRYSSERFFFLDEFMSKYDLKHVFHFESDVMIYFDINDLFKIFKTRYPGIGATFDNDERCIPGIFYVANRKALRKMVEYFANHTHESHLDMQMIANFKNSSHPKIIDSLPIIMDSYSQTKTLLSPSGKIAKDPSFFFNNYLLFQSIFDAAAIGQFLGGTHKDGPGFINESCVVNPSLLKYHWENDKKGRKIPYASYGNQKCRINNLHIHSKNLHEFASDKRELR